MRIAWTALSLLMLCAPAAAQGASSSAAAAVGASPASPAGLSDTDLELAVRAAYTAALDFAAAHDNYFARDGVFQPLRAAIVAAESTAYPTVAVADTAVSGDAAKSCLTERGAELRVSSNVFGDGLWLTVVTDKRLFSYTFDPHQSAEIVVQKATDCTRPN